MNIHKLYAIKKCEGCPCFIDTRIDDPTPVLCSKCAPPAATTAPT
jgi:hypothetical protein